MTAATAPTKPATTGRKPATKRKTTPKREVPAHLQDWAQILDAALTLPGTALTTYSRFYDYSLGNVILLAMQGVRTPVATFKRWSDMGYRVRKGSKAYFINRPILFKDRDDNGDNDSGETSDAATAFKIGGFKLVPCLFEAAQVDPDPAATTPPEPITTTDDTAEPITFETFANNVMRNLDITTAPFQSLDGNMQGYSQGRTIAISPVAAFPDKTMLHEIAHVVLGHTDTADPSSSTHRGIREVQAEAVALIVGRTLGLKLPEGQMRAYVQTWLRTTGTDAPTPAEIRPIFDACTRILNAAQAGKSTTTTDN